MTGSIGIVAYRKDTQEVYCVQGFGGFLQQIKNYHYSDRNVVVLDKHPTKTIVKCDADIYAAANRLVGVIDRSMDKKCKMTIINSSENNFDEDNTTPGNLYEFYIVNNIFSPRWDSNSKLLFKTLSTELNKLDDIRNNFYICLHYLDSKGGIVPLQYSEKVTKPKLWIEEEPQYVRPIRYFGKAVEELAKANMAKLWGPGRGDWKYFNCEDVPDNVDVYMKRLKECNFDLVIVETNIYRPSWRGNMVNLSKALYNMCKEYR